MPESGTQSAAACGARAEQTLLVPDDVWRGTGFASRIGCENPGEHSLKLGTPGLKYGRPLAFKTRMAVFYANLKKCQRNPCQGGVEARAGIEPAHTGFADQCITTLLPRRSRCREPGMVGGNGGMSTVGRWRRVCGCLGSLSMVDGCFQRKRRGRGGGRGRVDGGWRQGLRMKWPMRGACAVRRTKRTERTEGMEGTPRGMTAGCFGAVHASSLRWRWFLPQVWARHCKLSRTTANGLTAGFRSRQRL